MRIEDGKGTGSLVEVKDNALKVSIQQDDRADKLLEKIKEIRHILKHQLVGGSGASSRYHAELKHRQQEAEAKKQQYQQYQQELYVPYPIEEIPMPRSPIRIYDAVQRVVDELKNNQGFAQSWRDNIAMAFQDEFERHAHLAGMINPTDMYTLSNYAANNFLSQLCQPTREPLSTSIPVFSEEPEPEEVVSLEELDEAIEIARNLPDEGNRVVSIEPEQLPEIIVKKSPGARLFDTSEDLIVEEFQIDELTMD